MLAVSRARRALEGLPQAVRLLNTSSIAVRGVADGDYAGIARVKANPEESYGGGGQQAYQRRNFGGGPGEDGIQQHAAAAQHQQRDAEGGGGGGSGSSGSSSRRERRQQYKQRQQEHKLGKPLPKRRTPWEEHEGFRGNYRDPDSGSMGAEPYTRVAAKPAQRQHAMFPAYIYNVTPSLLRRDITAFFDGYNLPEEEVRPEYSWRQFEVERFWLNFGSRADRERAMSRHMAYLGTRRVLMRKASPHDFTVGIYNPLVMSSRGRYVLVSNLASSSTSEDVIRFFQGFDLHAKSVSFLRDAEGHHQTAGQQQRRRQGGGGGPSSGVTEVAVVRFISQMEAHRAVRDRQGGFCGNNQVNLRVLQ